ncbi:MAG: L-rhamnonate dehydratase [Dehalococcoidia bacterium]
MQAPRIAAVRTYIVGVEATDGAGLRSEAEHWIFDTLIANPMSGYPEYRDSRRSWGIGVLGAVVVEIETASGVVGCATGFGGPPVCFLIEQHFRRFLLGADPRDLNRIWDQLFRASMFYGRKGLALAAISVVDLALWDLVGRLRQEPVYLLIGGRTRDTIPCYCTGPAPAEAQRLGFWGGKLPLPHGPADGPAGLRQNVAFLEEHRRAVGPDFPLMVDCYMALDLPYTIELVTACQSLDLYWWEEPLPPDDVEGLLSLKQALPAVRWTMGEHEYTRYGFRRLIEQRAVAVLQPDVQWAGGLTELLRIAAMASAYDIPVVPHGSGPYSYHFVLSQPGSPFCEFINLSPDGRGVVPVFGDLFTDEPLPANGVVTIGDAPGFGLTLNPAAGLARITGSA